MFGRSFGMPITVAVPVPRRRVNRVRFGTKINANAFASHRIVQTISFGIVTHANVNAESDQLANGH